MRKPYDHQGYEIIVTCTATVIKDGQTVHTTRPCRLYVQAEGLADDWLRDHLGITYPDAITLQVDNLSVNPDNLF